MRRPRSSGGFKLYMHVEENCSRVSANVLGGKAKRRSQVYFMRDRHLVKIGFTAQLGSRMRNLRRDHPGAELLVAVEGSRDDERGLHDRFADARVTGEWFSPTAPLMELVQHCQAEGALPEIYHPNRMMSVAEHDELRAIDAAMKQAAETYRVAVRELKRQRSNVMTRARQRAFRERKAG